MEASRTFSIISPTFVDAKLTLTTRDQLSATLIFFNSPVVNLQIPVPDITFPRNEESIYLQMLRKLLSKLRQIHSLEGRLGKCTNTICYTSTNSTVGTMVPKKQPPDGVSVTVEGTTSKAGANPDPTVAYSRPPPLPPVLGPVVAFTLLDSWLKRDSDDD